MNRAEQPPIALSVPRYAECLQWCRVFISLRSTYYCDMDRGDHHCAPGVGGVLWHVIKQNFLNSTRRNVSSNATDRVSQELDIVTVPGVGSPPRVRGNFLWKISFWSNEFRKIFTGDDHNLHCAVSPGESWAASFIWGLGEKSPHREGTALPNGPGS